jgi:hypothetical protein
MQGIVEIKAIVQYREFEARYRIKREKLENTIYFALLEDYAGPTDQLPPVRITLTKGIRHWVGSSDDQNLIDELGKVIDISLLPEQGLHEQMNESAS